MALTIKYKSRFGIDVDTAYMRVDNLDGSKEEMRVTFGLYASAKAAQDGADAFDHYKHKFLPLLAGDNFIAQAYSSIKAVPDFENAQDC